MCTPLVHYVMHYTVDPSVTSNPGGYQQWLWWFFAHWQSMSASFQREWHGDDILTNSAHGTGWMKTRTQERIPDQYPWIHRFRQGAQPPQITHRMQKVPTPRITLLHFHWIHRKVLTTLLEGNKEGWQVKILNYTAKTELLNGQKFFFPVMNLIWQNIILSFWQNFLC